MAEIDEALKRLTSHKGIVAAVIVNSDGIPIRTIPAAMETKEATVYPGVLMPVIYKAKQMIKALDPSNDFASMRLRSNKTELLVYPEREYTLFVVQNASM